MNYGVYRSQCSLLFRLSVPCLGAASKLYISVMGACEVLAAFILWSGSYQV